MSLRAHLEQWLHRQWNKRGLFSCLLRPLSLLAQCYIQRKATQPRTTLSFTPPPIIVVGNIIIGGAGKTPVVLALCEFLKSQGWQPGIISRGYGVTIDGEPRVGQGQLDATQFGDEPALLAEQSQVPIAVHPKRVLALQALCAQHPEINVIIADDGLQHQALPRDVEIIVQDARGVGNGLILPAGPLREMPSRLSQADWLITQLAPGQSLPNTLTPNRRDRCVSMRLWPSYFKQLSTGKIIQASDWLPHHATDSHSAVAAIGQPDRFFSMLNEFGLDLEQQIALPDHAQPTVAVFAQLSSQFLLITAKDAVKCQSISDPRIWVVYAHPQFTPADWLLGVHQQLQSLTLVDRTSRENYGITST